MNFLLNRAHIQIISSGFFCIGLLAMILQDFYTGSVLMGIGFYVIMISESLLLSKVQMEMHNVLETMSAKRESEIQDLLYFLRHSQLSSKPFDNISSASVFIEKLDISACVITPQHTMHRINKAWTKLTGWTEDDLIGKRTEPIQCPDSYGTVAIELAQSFHQGDFIRHTRYCYMNSENKRIEGWALIIMFPDSSGAMSLFFPTERSIIK